MIIIMIVVNYYSESARLAAPNRPRPRSGRFLKDRRPNHNTYDNGAGAFRRRCGALGAGP